MVCSTLTVSMAWHINLLGLLCAWSLYMAPRLPALMACSSAAPETHCRALRGQRV
jgi:hypothetical protein